MDYTNIEAIIRGEEFLSIEKIVGKEVLKGSADTTTDCTTTACSTGTCD